MDTLLGMNPLQPEDPGDLRVLLVGAVGFEPGTPIDAGEMRFSPL
jgi:hypothetical protein